MSCAVLEAYLKVLTSCRDENYLLGLEVFSPSRRHCKIHLHYDICEN